MITLLTCTGDRPECFARLETWMARQTLMWSKWIVIDDGHEPTKCNLGQAYVRMEPGKSPRGSFAENYRVGLDCARSSKFVAVIEDDDWYARGYLQHMIPLLLDAELAGESHARYYNVAERKYRSMGNTNHASLCQTAFRGDLVPQILPLVLDESAFLDTRLWKLDGVSKVLTPSAFSVGLKGQAGRKGIGTGHRPKDNGKWHDDSDGDVLREWIGDDAQEVLDGSP